MYIRFRLPQGAGGLTASVILPQIKREVESWAQQYGIRYTQKTIKYEHRVAFDHDETYTLWAMTWNPRAERRFEYELVNVAGEKY